MLQHEIRINTKYATVPEKKTIDLIEKYNKKTHHGYFLTIKPEDGTYRMVECLEAKISWMSGTLSTINAHLRDSLERF